MMRFKITPSLLALGLGLGGGAMAAADSHPDYADSAEAVRPLLIGAQVPDIPLKSIDGDPVSLKEAVAAQPSVLIFYRGGW